MRTFILIFHIAISHALFAQPFLLVSDSTGLSISTNSNGIAAADYDLDGDLDIYIVGADRYRNDHNTSACWWDYDLDGDLDLYVSAWIGENIMYENKGQNNFADVTDQTGLGDNGQTWTSLPLDANNDHLPDLYAVNDFGPNKFYVNEGDGTFREATVEFGLEDEGNGMGVALADYNNDGFFDIYLTNISSFVPCQLFENQGNGTFIDKSRDAGIDDAGWAWGTEFFDYDHDGALDLYVVNGHREESSHKNYLFYNLLESDKVAPEERGPYYWNVSDSSGANSIDIARALLNFDYDDDGDLDLLVGNRWSTPHLFENQSETKNWLKVQLEGSISNRNAFGASVSITCGNKKYYRSNDGIDFLGQSIVPLHFGLGDAAMIDTLTVFWPTGGEEFITEVPVNQTIKIVEQEGLVTGIENEKATSAKSGFYLISSYPNPFNGTATIKYSTPHSGNGQFTVFNILGQEIYTRDFIASPGQNSIQWNSIA